MKKVNITLTFDDDKLDALEFSLRKEHSSVQAHMDDALKQLYEQTVPEAGAGVSGQQDCTCCQTQAHCPNLPYPKRRVVSRRPWQPW